MRSPPVTRSQPPHWPYMRCHVISLPSSSQNRTGCWVRGLSAKNKTRKHCLVEEVSGNSARMSESLRSPSSPLPAAHQNELRLRAGFWKVGQERARRRRPRPQTPASLGYPLSGVPGHAHPHTHLPGSGGILSSSSSPGLNARQCAAK